MRKKLHLNGKLLFAGTLLSAGVLTGSDSRAQLVSGNIFLKGNYVEAGICPNGAFGTSAAAPTGYHPRDGSNYLGFVSDPDKDGWSTGAPTGYGYYGDFFLPGSPQEGWGMMIGSSTYQAFRGVTSILPTGVTGGTMSYVDSTYIRKGTWQGAIGNLQITQTTSIKPNDLYLTTFVKLKNTGSTAITGVYYTRTVDPDNEAAMGGSTITRNKIVDKLPSVGNKVLVEGVGTSYGAYLGLGAKDSRAKPYVLNGGLFPTSSLSDIYSGTSSASGYYYDTTTRLDDAAIGIVFNIGTIAAGDSTTLAYAYVLGRTYVDTAFAFIAAALPLDFTSFRATAVNCKAELNWTYNTDEQMAYFSVERSVDGQQFTPVARLADGTIAYTDAAPGAEKVYYRVKATGVNGKLYYTPVTAVTFDLQCLETVSAYVTPNPARNSVQLISKNGNRLSGTSVKLVDASGKIIREQAVSEAAVSIDLSNLPAGVYTLQLSDGQTFRVNKVD